MTNKMIIFSAPSGAGKTTIVRHLLRRFPALEFSISATTRARRGAEQHAKDYFFLTHDEFMERVQRGDFAEWEEVYPGLCYGTLKSEMERIWAKGHVIAFDIDVQGGLNLKRMYGAQALAVFVRPPSLEALRQRLERRGTDKPETVRERLDKATCELGFAAQFDVELVNDHLDDAKLRAEQLVAAFLSA
ncbi:MAG: guanylate kinase [Prevotellaceae bacterium]|jgi:guanylate kinase|nr:guanylate kinase [Prevotellaceae bacterium]